MKKSLLSILFFFSILSTVHAWTPLDTLQIKEIGKIVISPSEKKIAYEVMVPIVNEEKGIWKTEVHIKQNVIESNGNEVKKVSLKNYVNNSIEWCSDNSIFFISKENNRDQICQFFLEDERTEILFDNKLNVTVIQPSHRGDKIAFLALQKSKINSCFEIIDEILPKSTLHILDLASKDVKEVIVENFSIGSLNWSPDDEFIVFDYQPSAKIEDRVLYSKISKIHLPSNSITSLVKNDSSNFNPRYSLDGKKIAYVSAPGTWEFTFHVHVIDNITGQHIQLANTPDEQVELIGWLSNKLLLVVERYHTTQRLYALSTDGLDCTSISPPENLILQPKISSKGNLIAFRSESPTQPCEVFISETLFKPLQISHIHTKNNYPKLNTKIISWETTDGKVIEGLLTLPTNHVNAPYPLLVLIRGHSSLYLNTYEAGIHLSKTPYSIGVFADNGYAVLRPFFRGSSGYGRLMRNSIQGDWGGKDFDDLIDGINYLAEEGIIDSERMGIMGWSYGGFMTATAITKTGRFKAASAGGALVNFVSYTGTTDIPHFLPHYMNGWFWNNPQTWKDHSPIEHVSKARTPTLIQHSSGDKRVPVSQAFELYNALKYRGIPTKFILYADSGHSLSNPKVIIEGIQHNLDWFNFWIQNNNPN